MEKLIEEKRGRGRPRKDVATNLETTIKKGRGRPKKVVSEEAALKKPSKQRFEKAPSYGKDKGTILNVNEIKVEKKDRLTQLVLDYRALMKESVEASDENQKFILKHKADRLMPEILKLTRASIFEIIGYYGVNNFDQLIQDEIIGDCESSVLIKTIEAFDPGRNTKFNTFYMWRLKSHIRSRKEFFMRRKDVLSTQSIEEVLFEDGGHPITLADVVTDCNISTLARSKRAREIMALAGDKLKNVMSKIT